MSLWRSLSVKGRKRTLVRGEQSWKDVIIGRLYCLVGQGPLVGSLSRITVDQ